jgi:hypothetical protein
LRRALAAALLVLAPSCGVLDHVVRVVDPETGVVSETTVGDLAADALDQSTPAVSDAASGAVSAVTQNPVLGAGAGAVLATLLGAASTRMRRKKGGGQTAVTEPPTPPQA